MSLNQVAELNAEYIERPTENRVPVGYKQTEAGVIPEDWEVKQLKELFSLKNGYSFKGEFFSSKGPIVLTPGNFKLEGGLYFEARNTKRYAANYPKGYEFKKGDLIVVMTDLTPDCNLLGKPAFIDIEEQVLHNQRIGKITKLAKNWESGFLYYTLLSPSYLSTIKNAATGSTVRHTSPKTIASAWVAEPPQKEQTAIANALSDVDALISELEKLIAKKQAIKTATMQQLLTGRTRLAQFALREDGTPKGTKASEIGEIPEDWEAIKMGGLAKIQRGASPRPIDSPMWFERNSTVGWLRISDVSKTNKYLTETTQSLSELGIANSRFVPRNNLVMSICATVGKPIITKKDLCIHDGFVVFNGLSASQDYMYYILKELEDEWGKQGQTGSQMNLNTDLINSTYVAIPKKETEQTTIATILSDMDEEIQALEQRLSKTRQIKQGMMQELLTGKTRLI